MTKQDLMNAFNNLYAEVYPENGEYDEFEDQFMRMLGLFLQALPDEIPSTASMSFHKGDK